MAVKGSLTNKVERTIEDMDINEEGYSVPWALSFERRGDGMCDVFLNIKYSVTKEAGGTATLYIRRTGEFKEDFEVDLDSVDDYQFSIGKADYIGTSKYDVVRIGQIELA